MEFVCLDFVLAGLNRLAAVTVVESRPMVLVTVVVVYYARHNTELKKDDNNMRLYMCVYR